jgi:hypothetical protein
LDVFTNISRILTAKTPSEAIDIARSWTNFRLENLGIPKQFPNDTFPALPPRTSSDLDEPSDEDSQQEDDLLTVDGLSDSTTGSSNSPSPPPTTHRRRGAQHGRDR